jgi:hypothetical protein
MDEAIYKKINTIKADRKEFGTRQVWIPAKALKNAKFAVEQLREEKIRVSVPAFIQIAIEDYMQRNDLRTIEEVDAIAEEAYAESSKSPQVTMSKEALEAFIKSIIESNSSEDEHPQAKDVVSDAE